VSILCYPVVLLFRLLLNVIVAAAVQALEKEIFVLSEEHQALLASYETTEDEKARLYANFEATIEAVRSRSDFKNLLLEKRLADLQAEFDARQATLNEVCSAAVSGVTRWARSTVSLHLAASSRCFLSTGRVWSLSSSSSLSLSLSLSRGVCARAQVLVAANLDPSALAIVGQRLDQLLDERNRVIRDLRYNVARVTKAHNDAMRVYETKLREMGVAVEETGFVPLATDTGVGPAGLVVTRNV
jgi:hypothetical protein